MLRVNNRLWLISDTHFGHKNIIKYQGRPAGHEIIMVSEWIRRVGEDDQILHLGDVTMGKRGNADRWLDVIGRLPGEKFLILGNHDDPEALDYGRGGFTVIPEFVHKGVAFSHRPVARRTDPATFSYLLGEGWHTNIHGHVHNNVWTSEHDGAPLSARRYINVSVEKTGLAPVQLGNIYPVKGGEHT